MESKPIGKKKDKKGTERKRERDKGVGQKGIIEAIWSELQVGYK
jgi:hypothetical protein